MATSTEQERRDKNYCGAHRKQGETCKRPAGWGTSHPGYGTCKLHGGSTPDSTKHAETLRADHERQQAAAEWNRSFGTPTGTGDPAETVLTEIRWCAGHVAWLRDRVQELEPEALVWGVESEINKTATEFPGVDLTSSAKVNVWVRLYGEERDRLLRMCKVAHSMGIAERQVELAERIGSLMAGLLRGLLDDLDLSDAQRELASAAVPRHLQTIARELAA